MPHFLLQYTVRGGTFDDQPARLRLEVLCRKWEVAELVRDMDMLEDTAAAMDNLALAGPAYRLMAIYYRAILYKLSSRYQEAKAEIEKGLEIAREGGVCYLKPMLLYVLGSAKYHLSDFQTAIDHFQEALSLLGPDAKPSDRMRTLGDIGLAYWKTGRFDRSLEIFSEAETLARGGRDTRNEAVFKTNKASVMLSLNQVDTALALYREALAISQRIGDFQNRSILHNNIGAILIRQGQYQQAAGMLEDGISLDRMCGAVGNLTGKLNNLAIIKAMFGDTGLARDLFAEALKADRASGNLNNQMIKLCNMADLSMMLDDYQTGLVQIEEAVDLSRRIQAQAYLAHNLAVKADICLHLGMGTEALKAAEEALSISENSDNMDNKLHSLIVLVNAQSALGMTEAALEGSERAIDLAERGQNFEMGPERAFLCRYEVLAQAGREKEGIVFREKAAKLLKDKADELAMPDERARFLEYNAVYRKLKQMGVEI